MPFCTNCGTKVEANASFCHNCGAAQHRAAASQTLDDMLSGISVRTAIILCYIPVFGVIPAIVFLAGHRFRTNYRVRFNAFQSLYLFVTWLILSSAIPTLFSSGFPGWPLEHLAFGLVKIAVIVCWIYLLFKASQEQQVRLPIIGDLAARSTHEQI